MFSISTFKSRIIDSNNVLKLIEDKDKHEFDLLNENYYGSNGNLIENTPDPDIRYREKFLRLLRENKYHIVRILDYHYSKTEDKELFYNYVKVDLSRNSYLDDGIKLIINEWLINLNKSSMQTDKEIPNDIIDSTIDDYLLKFVENKKIDDENYTILKSALNHYFNKGFFKIDIPKIKVKNMNKRIFGKELNKLFKEFKYEKLDLKYLLFAKQHISLFENTSFDEDNYQASNLYKYFTS
jgi:hypothetical protein